MRVPLCHGLPLIEVLLESSEDPSNFLRSSQIGQRIGDGVWYMSRNKGVSFS